MVDNTRAPADGPPASRFARLAGWSYRHRWLALLVWLVAVVGVSVGAQAAGTAYRNDFSLPGTESQRALDTLRAEAPVAAGSTVQIVLADPDGLRTPDTQRRVTAMLAEVDALPHVAAVGDPYRDPGSLSADGTIGYATVTLDVQATDMPAEDTKTIVETAQRAESDGLRVELGGETVQGVEEGGGGPAEGIGMLAALVILVFLFGSLLAASLPLVIAIFAVATAIGLAMLASNVATIAEFTTPLMILVGLGVGIDYALLLFSRFRTEILAGYDRAEATRRAVDTAGRTVLFAGLTVIVALLGLVVLGLGSLQGVAVAVGLTVLATMLAALTLLPALLGLMGGRIERSIHKRSAKSGRDGQGWRRWTLGIQRRPWTAALLATVALLALSAPVLGMRLGIADAGNNAETKTSRQAYDLLAEGFGPGFNGPLIVVVEGDRADAEAAREAARGTDGVAEVPPPVPLGDDVSMLIVVSDAKPQDARTQELVDRLRADVLPPVERTTGAQLMVGGPTAATVDFAAAVSARMPLFVLVVVGLSSLLLLLVFRSVLIPIKAAVLNLLSVGASLGVVTLVFQHGWLGGPLGIQPGPIEAFVPIMIFAIAFGLSMDYEVFLLARMHEHWERHRDAPAAIREGMATTGRIVTAAAAIMVVVFGSFLLDPGRMLKQFGLGLAVAVLVDALVIRCLILPAVMHLFGTRAWWLPAPLARMLPRVALEKVEDPHPEPVGGVR
ncbi:MMPL family transporter [Plantactinospora sp. GCM10030261]|uniref:MMPL family transporter n=1 Tax=Plantactinospora sp. GCM10030261 TaxID=3273420 RepID=UPI003615E0DE